MHPVDETARYSKNLTMLSPAESDSLRTRRVCVVGCGGLGGALIEMLGRLGVGRITAVDGDVFEPTNLNRQLLSTEQNLGAGKAEAAVLRMKAVNSGVEVTAVAQFLDEGNCGGVIAGHDLVVDALDTIPARLMLQDACAAQGIPLVHGAIAGWQGQVSVVLPGDDTLRRIYTVDQIRARGIEQELGNAPFTAWAVASLQAAEAVKLLLGRGDLLRNKLLRVNLLHHTYLVWEMAPGDQ